MASDYATLKNILEQGQKTQVWGPATETEIAAAEKELGIVFPPSYRAFLRHFGAGCLQTHEIYGLPNGWLKGDVVMMNQLSPRKMPRGYVKIMDDFDDCTCYLNTSRTDEDGECPVVAVNPDGEEAFLARSFIDLLQKICAGNRPSDFPRHCTAGPAGFELLT